MDELQQSGPHRRLPVTAPRPAAARQAPRGGSGNSGASRSPGFTLIGLLFWALLIGFVAYVAVRTTPAVNEYLTVLRAVQRVADSGPATVGEARADFDKQKDIEYAITSIGGKDLDITKEGGRVVVAFAYDREIPLYGPVYLLLKFQGRSTR